MQYIKFLISTSAWISVPLLNKNERVFELKIITQEPIIWLKLKQPQIFPWTYNFATH